MNQESICYQGKDIREGVSASERKLQKDIYQVQETAVLQTPCLQSFENQHHELLSYVKSGNIQGLQQYLSNWYVLQKNYRSKMGARVISRSQFLSRVQALLEDQGLIFDRRLRNICSDTLQHS